MSILNITQASRAGSRLLVQFFGESQSGKTLSALLFARGLAGDDGKVIVIDTESGRAKLYSDKVPGGFLHANLRGPFSASRYREAIIECLAAGADVIVIDSFSHAWDGEGGVLDQADKIVSKDQRVKWAASKAPYKRLVQTIMTCGAHVVICSRAKRKLMKVGSEMVLSSPEPIQESGLRYEMTLCIPMSADGFYVTKKKDEFGSQQLKVPGDLEHLFSGGQVSVDLGREVAKWVAGGEAEERGIGLLNQKADDAASGGMASYQEFFQSLTPAEKRSIMPRHDDLKSAARAADAEREIAIKIGNDATEESPAITEDEVSTLAIHITEKLNSAASKEDLRSIAASRGWAEMKGYAEAFPKMWEGVTDCLIAAKERLGVAK